MCSGRCSHKLIHKAFGEDLAAFLSIEVLTARGLRESMIFDGFRWLSPLKSFKDLTSDASESAP